MRAQPAWISGSDAQVGTRTRNTATGTTHQKAKKRFGHVEMHSRGHMVRQIDKRPPHEPRSATISFGASNAPRSAMTVFGGANAPRSAITVCGIDKVGLFSSFSLPFLP